MASLLYQFSKKKKYFFRAHGSPQSIPDDLAFLNCKFRGQLCQHQSSDTFLFKVTLESSRHGRGKKQGTRSAEHCISAAYSVNSFTACLIASQGSDSVLGL